MRLAVLPSAQLENPYADGSTRGWLNWSKALVESDPEVFVYFLAPEQYRKKLRPERRIKFLFSGRMEPYADQEVTAPPDFWSWFSARTGQYPVDAIATSRSGAGVALSRQVWDYRSGDDLLPVVINESKAIDSDEHHMPATDAVLASRTLSYVMGWPVFNSQWELQTALSAARKYLNASTAKRVMEHAKVITPWLDHQRIDRAVEGVERSNEFRVFFGGRLNAAKRAKDLFRICDQFYKSGRSVRIVICSPRAENNSMAEWERQYPHFEFHAGLSGEDFYREAAKSHVYLNTSATEGFSFGFLEQLYIGLVPIFPDAQWTRAVLGDSIVNDYPFAYQSFDEASLYLKQVYDDYESAKERVNHIPSLVKEMYARPELENALYDYVKYLVEAIEIPGLPIMTVDMVRRAVKRLDRPFTLNSLYALVSELSTGFSDSPTRGQPSRWSVYKWLKANGFRDLCDGPEPRFIDPE